MGCVWRVCLVRPRPRLLRVTVLLFYTLFRCSTTGSHLSAEGAKTWNFFGKKKTKTTLHIYLLSASSFVFVVSVETLRMNCVCVFHHSSLSMLKISFSFSHSL